MNKPKTAREILEQSVLEADDCSRYRPEQIMKVIDDGISELRTLLIEGLPKKKDKSFLETSDLKEVEYYHYSGTIDGFDDCLHEVKSAIYKLLK
jgi:hypothetical protein